MTEKAAGVGFDWRRTEDVLEKLDEELDEWKAELVADDPESRKRASEELGDILFVITNVARRLGLDPEHALQRSNDKFRARFDAVAALLEERGGQLGEASLEEMDRLWDEVKSRARSSEP